MTTVRHWVSISCVLAIFIMACGDAPALSATKQIPQSRSSQPSTTIAMYSPLWRVGQGFSSTLILRNTDSQNAVAAKVTIFSPQGEREQTTQLHVPPSSASRFDIATLSRSQEQSNTAKWGSLQVEYTVKGKMLPLMGQVVIENDDQGVILDLHLQGGYTFDTAKALYAPWWLPDNGTAASIMLFNPTGTKIVVSPSVAVSGNEQTGHDIVLEPRETIEVSLRDLLREVGAESATEGALTLRYTGQSHALQPALLLSNAATGFSLVCDFHAKHDQLADRETTWWFPDVFLAPDEQLGFHMDDQFTTYALLSNGTKAALAAQVKVSVNGFGAQQTRQIALPVDALQPLETRLVNVSAFVESGLIPKGVTHVALEANHQGVAGDLGINVFSVGQNQNFVFRAEGSPVYSHTVYSSYWDIANELVALMAVQNAGDEDVQAEATLYYQTPHGTGSYTLPQIELPGKGSRILNLKQRIQSGAPDKHGNVIPPGTTFGTLTLNTIGSNTKSFIFGGSTSFDPVLGGYGTTTGGGDPPPCCPDDPDCQILTFAPVLQGGGDPETCDSGGTGGNTTPTRVIKSITPSRALIGNTMPVTISGSGLGTSGWVVAVCGAPTSFTGNAGVTITINTSTSSDSAINATFAISSTATTGQLDLCVNAGDGGGAITHFYVQMPTSASFTLGAKSVYNGNVYTECDGTVVGPRWGYGYCGMYQLLDQDSPPMPIQGDYLNLTAQETVTVVASNPGATSHSGNNGLNNGGMWGDELSFLAVTSPAPQPGNFIKNKQSWTLVDNNSAKTYSSIRVNCLDFESTGLTVTDITKIGGTCE